MSGAATESGAAAANVGLLVDPRRDLAVRRTKIAIEGASMAWLRTVLSMISFGFATYKPKTQGPKITDREPKNVGFALDGLGTLPLMAASVQSWGRIHDPQSRVRFGRASRSCVAHRRSHCWGGRSGFHQHRAPGCPFQTSGMRVKETVGGLHANARGDTCRRPKY